MGKERRPQIQTAKAQKTLWWEQKRADQGRKTQSTESSEELNAWEGGKESKEGDEGREETL